MGARRINEPSTGRSGKVQQFADVLASIAQVTARDPQVRAGADAARAGTQGALGGLLEERLGGLGDIGPDANPFVDVPRGLLPETSRPIFERFEAGRERVAQRGFREQQLANQKTGLDIQLERAQKATTAEETRAQQLGEANITAAARLKLSQDQQAFTIERAGVTDAQTKIDNARADTQENLDIVAAFDASTTADSQNAYRAALIEDVKTRGARTGGADNLPAALDRVDFYAKDWGLSDTARDEFKDLIRSNHSVDGRIPASFTLPNGRVMELQPSVNGYDPATGKMTKTFLDGSSAGGGAPPPKPIPKPTRVSRVDPAVRSAVNTFRSGGSAENYLSNQSASIKSDLAEHGINVPNAVADVAAPFVAGVRKVAAAVEPIAAMHEANIKAQDEAAFDDTKSTIVVKIPGRDYEVVTASKSDVELYRSKGYLIGEDTSVLSEEIGGSGFFPSVPVNLHRQRQNFLEKTLKAKGLSQGEV